MASRSLGTLTVDILAKTGLLEQGLDKGGRAAQKFARDIDRQANAVQASFDKAFKAVGIAAGAAFAAVGVAVKSSIDDMYDLVTRAKQVAMPIDQFSAYAAAAGDAEVSIDSFSTALRKLDQSLTMAKQGSAQSTAAFKALGIDPAKIKTTQQAFEAIADAFSKYRDDASKVAIAQQLLGRGGTEMIAFLDQGSAAIDKLAEHQKVLHNVVGEEGKRDLEAYDDAMDEFHGTIKGLSNTLALALLPELTDVTKKATDFIQAWSNNGGLQKFIDGLQTLIDHLGEIATFFAARFVAVRVVAGLAAIGTAAGAAGTAVGLLKVALAAVGGVFGLVATGVAALAVGFYNYANQVNPAVQSTDDLREAVEKMQKADKDAIGPATEHAKAVLKIAQANLVAANAELTRLQQVSEAAEQSRRKYGDASISTSYHPDVVVGADGKFAPGGFTNAKDMQSRVAAQRKLIADLKTQIDSATKSLDTRGLFAGLGSGDGSKPSIDIPKTATDAKAALDKLTGAYDALAKASNQYANSLTADDPLQKANEAMAAGVENLAKLREAYVKAGGSAKLADELFDKGLTGLKDKFTFDLGQPKRELDAYTGSLRDQLNALKASNDAKLQGMTLGEHAAANALELAQATQEATKAITDFVQAHQLHPEAMSEDMYSKELDALKDYYAQRQKLIQQNQDSENAIRADMSAGWQKGIADFIEQTQDKFQQGQQLAQQFTSGFADAFEKFASGAESAKKAFGDFIDDLFAQALRLVANNVVAGIFNALQTPQAGNTSPGAGGGWGSLFTSIAGMFGGGRAGGGPVAAGGLYEVNERGAPELLAVGGRQFLMMGPQAGTVKPATQSHAAGATINVAVQPTSSYRTASQVAQAVARQQQLAMARA